MPVVAWEAEPGGSHRAAVPTHQRFHLGQAHREREERESIDLSNLTDEQWDVAELLARGLSSVQAARAIGVSERTSLRRRAELRDLITNRSLTNGE